MEYNNFLETQKLHVLLGTDHKGKKLSVKQKSGELRKQENLTTTRHV